jgi:hypothetical protein
MEFRDSSEGNSTDTDEMQQDPSNQADRPPPTILTSATNLLVSEKLRSIVKGNIEFHNTRRGARVFTKKKNGRLLSHKGCHGTPSFHHAS